MNDDGLKQYTVPNLWKDRVKKICLWADHDAESNAGFNACMEAALRLRTEGYQVIIIYPNYGADSVDWQEIVQNQNILALPMEHRKKALRQFANVSNLEPLEFVEEEVHLPEELSQLIA